MKVVKIPIDKVTLNNGQIEGLPANPRQWTKEDVKNIAASLKETPELFEARPLLVVPHGDEYVILGGNLRYTGAKQLKAKEVPCIVFDEDTPLEKMREIVIKDNGSFGAWDYDALANSWDDLPLTSWGVPAWETDALSTKGRSGDETYAEFTGKFDEELPLTTDDCYTPKEVYDAVLEWVDRRVLPLKGKRVLRPFFPGGDYQKAEYPDGCIVIDNPPFSIYAEIVRWYLAKGIPFFLFGPSLTLFIADADCCFCAFGVPIKYENGAVVSTGFVTNLLPYRIFVDNELRDTVMAAQKAEPVTPVYEYPDEIITAGLLHKISNGGTLIIRPEECRFIRNCDGMKDIDRGLFGGGFILARAAAEKARAAAEKARAAAEKARAVKITLSDREKAIVDELDKQSSKQWQVKE